jgi:hypothetical protein
MTKYLCVFFIFCATVSQAQDYRPSLLIPYHSKAKWGYSDTLGRVQIQPAYDSVSFFQEQGLFAIVSQKKKQGIINAQGRLLLKASYDKIDGLFPYQFYVIQKENQFGLFDARQEKIIIPTRYSEISSFSDSLFLIKLNDKQGIARQDGKVIIAPSYDFLTRAEFWFEYENVKGKAIGRKGQEAFLIDLKTGNVDKTIDSWSDDVVMEDVSFDEEVEDLSSIKAGLKNIHDFDSVTSIQVHARYYGQKTAYKTYKNGKVGLIYPSFFKMEPTYEDIAQVAEVGQQTYLHVIRDKKAGVINQDQKIILPFVYDQLTDMTPSSIKTVRNNKMGMALFNTSYPPIDNLYESIQHDRTIPVSKTWGFAVFKVKRQGMWGYVGENGVEFFK